MRLRLHTLIGFCILWFCSNMALAGPGHDHGSHSHDPINASQAKQMAKKVVDKLVGKKKLPDSWKAIDNPTAETKIFSGKKEWVVSFNNPNITDQAKQTLYIFLTINGDYLAANYTGN